MTREEIEKAAEDFCEANKAIEYPEFFVDFAIQQVNKALDEAIAKVGDEIIEPWWHHRAMEAVRALKIPEEP